MEERYFLERCIDLFVAEADCSAEMLCFLNIVQLTFE